MAQIERHVAGRHLKLTQVVLHDGTDRHNELVQELEWLLHPSERSLSLSGNLFSVENVESGTGTVFLKEAPLPHARGCSVPADLTAAPDSSGGWHFHLSAGDCETTDSFRVIEYTGGAAGRIAALHSAQFSARPATDAHRVPRFLTNTWGDRSQDTRIRADFILREIESAAAIGADIVQIDDGWQRGRTSNSAYATDSGKLEGFWNTDENFWDVDGWKFPDGLEPIIQAAKRHGVEIGLWFAPDSWREFAFWERDAARVLELHALGIRFFKIDGVTAATSAAQTNLARFFDAVAAGSSGEIALDLDITAGVRPGYFGAMSVGPLFVENRYTDWTNYWPHQTLRNLWTLSRWIDPRRLRMEFLNTARNRDHYAGDPLAPERWPADSLFASVMTASPLGWFEVQNLPEASRADVASVVGVWRQHRDAYFAGRIRPIGECPDGFSWTGFMSVGNAGDHASLFVLIFREGSSSATGRFQIPELARGAAPTVLAGSGSAGVPAAGVLEASIEAAFGFLFLTVSGAGDRVDANRTGGNQIE